MTEIIRNQEAASAAARCSRARPARSASRPARAPSPAFPTVHSAEPKVLRYLGTAVNQGDEIAKKCLKDTGIKIEYITATTDDVTKRVITQPNSFDMLDTEYFSLKKLVPSGNILAHRRQEDQGIRQDHARSSPRASCPTARRSATRAPRRRRCSTSKAQNSKKFADDADRIRDADPDRLQRRHARHPAGPDQAADRIAGPNC